MLRLAVLVNYLLYFVYRYPPYNKVYGVGLDSIKKKFLVTLRIVWLIQNQVKVTMHKKGSLYDICIVNLEQL